MMSSPKSWFPIAVASLCLCGGLRGQNTAKVAAGDFEVEVPVAWMKKIIVEKVPIQPVYSAEEWKAYKADPMNILKPSYACRPQHWAIRFPVLSLEPGIFDAAKAGDHAAAPQILIHKADEWEAAGQNGQVVAATAAQFVSKLREAMKKGKKDEAYGDPAFMDAEMHFVTGRKRIDFKGGHGFRMLTQWTVEADFARRGSLHYLFLGFSDDGTCQIIATIPVNLPGLPEDKGDDGKHLGWTFSQILAHDFDAYERDVQRWLKDSASKVTPSLDALDTMIASLKVERWK